MKISRKNWFHFGLFISFLVQVWVLPLTAREVRILTSPLTDEAGILPLEKQNQITNILSAIETKTSAQVYVYIIPSLEGENLESYSLAVAEKSKLGQKDKDNGVLVLLSTGDRKVRIEVGYGLEETLTDVLCNRIIRNIMIPEFKKGEIPQGLVSGVLAVESILYGNIDSNPALNTNYPDGIGMALTTNSTGNHIGFTLGILIIAWIINLILKENKIYKDKKWLEILYGVFVFSGILYFFPDAVFYLFCIGLVGVNLYLLYGLWFPLSYFYSLLSLAFWIPFLHFTFNIGFPSLFWIFGIISSVFITTKIVLDDVITNKFYQIAKYWGMSSKELLLHIISFFTLGFSIFSFWNGEGLVYIFFYQGLILFTIYGLGFKSFRFKPFQYFIALILWLFFVAGFVFYTPRTGENSGTYNLETMVNWFQWFNCFVSGYILAKSIEVDSWKYRFLKYTLISLVWTLGFSFHYLLGFSNHWSAMTFVFSYGALLIIHFLTVIANESGSGSYSSYSSSSSSSSYSSSSYSSSSSSSSSGGGGGSFGGGGSSGSW
ncbi:TPM domain-containing protein [Leptospira perdikensis]|uniref:TPM domain-containing protein n=1 Tax=Leptospira perdikensis TaxID=2484948 RepID=A0A4R9JJ97_9LEPT|nr:TPM domain-containing protein [Leptospira perdikensis]TGL45033.1 TPM domain-containing protein [Leptospira perdikensis]